jgi:hypothetical protein
VTVNRSVEVSAERNLEDDTRLRWRKKRYGEVCLTLREYEAITLEMVALQPLPWGPQRVNGEAVQGWIAGHMHVSQQWVSELLQRADKVIEAIIRGGADPVWIQVEGRWIFAGILVEGISSCKVSHLCYTWFMNEPSVSSSA